MTTDPMPPRQDSTDDAVRELIEYLVVAGTVEGELNGVPTAIRRLILALHVAEEAAAGLTSYRRRLLEQLRASGHSADTA